MSDSQERENPYRDVYTLEQRKNWYNDAANAYHKTRPRYPQALISRVVVSPEIRYIKAAKALKENGSLILLWNIALQPEYEVCQILQEVHHNQAISVSPYENRETHERDLIKFGNTIIDSELPKIAFSLLLS